MLLGDKDTALFKMTIFASNATTNSTLAAEFMNFIALTANVTV
jgi:hypothetical protein